MKQPGYLGNHSEGGRLGLFEKGDVAEGGIK
jgi:hypothetical protein